MGLNVCECARKAKSHPEGWVSSLQLSGKITAER